MTEAVVEIKKWGDSLGVRLPAGVARAARLKVDQRVRVTVEGDRVFIDPIVGAPPTLTQRLAVYDPLRHGGEQMSVARALGAERC